MEQPLYDLSTLKTISRGNEAFVLKMVDIFCEQTPVMLAEMENAFKMGELIIMGKIAHQVKPSIDNLNISELRPVIRGIENAAENKTTGLEIQEMLDKLDHITRLVISRLRNQYPS